MTSQASNPNVQDLQRQVIALLQEVSTLMGRASKELKSEDSSENKYQIYQQEIEKEIGTVTDLKLRMAIAAPMNAGKSKIINAIIGQELLPSSATAMTTLPTEIVLKENAAEPILKLSPGICEAFKKALDAIRLKIEQQGMEEVLKHTGEYPHLASLLQEIHSDTDFGISEEIYGSKNINKILTELNHIIRLCNILAVSQDQDPLQLLNDNDIPSIETPFFITQQNQQLEKLGNLVIVDTPGPSEAGVSEKLEIVVSKQLKRSQLVLLVLNFTELRAEAAEKIKAEVQKVIRTSSQENLYVLVNKIDERRRGDIDTEMVKQFVANNLKLGDTDHVFEVSARQAFCAKDFLRQSSLSSQDIKDPEAAEALAREFWPVNWEDELKEATVDKLQKIAVKLWEVSKFESFLEEAINVILLQVAPRCMEFALNRCLIHLDDLCNNAKNDLIYINSNAEKLQQAIKDLNKELSSLAACRKSLDEEVAKTKKQINETVNANLEKLKKDGKKELDILLKDYVWDSAITSFSTAFNDFLNRDKNEFKNKDEFEFNNKQDAKLFAEKIVASANKIIERQLNVASKKTEEQTKDKIQELSKLLDSRTKPIIEGAQVRLNKEFDVTFKPDTLKLVDIYIEVNTPDLEFRGYGLSDLLAAFLEEAFGNLFVQFAAGLVAMVANNPILSTIYGFVSTVFGWLFRVDLNKHLYKERYTVNIILFQAEVVKLFNNKIEEIQKQSNRLIDQSFDEPIQMYFEALDSILGDYRKDLEQSLKAQALPLETLKKLKQALESFSVGNDKLQVDKLKEKANELLSQTKPLIAS
ncbi:dynamin family protein [Microcoleus sp. N9_A1]|uniref:dynamin family protein n=1 Tax=Microcoleus sp. N9_A1 TaxID=3055380 RepID=UPI002FD1A5C4